MSAIKFRCEACDYVWRPSGTRRAVERCPDCGARVSDDPEDDAPPRPRRRKQRSGDSNVGLIIVGAVVGGLFLVGTLGLAAYLLLARPFASDTDRYIREYTEGADLLSQVNDKASAEAARKQLVRLGYVLRDEEERFQNGMHHEEVEDAARKEPVRLRFVAEVRRVRQVPGGHDLLQAFAAAWGSGANAMWAEVDQPNGFAQARPQVDQLPPPPVLIQQPQPEPLPPSPVIQQQPEPLPPPPAITPQPQPPDFGRRPAPRSDPYQQVKVGMTDQQVIDILGRPAFVQNNNEGPGSKQFQYAVGFIRFKNGRVSSKWPDR